MSRRETGEGTSRWLTHWRVRWYSRALLLGCGIGFVVAIVGGEEAHTLTGRLGGDFPAFYSAGRLVASGEFESIYDLDRMTEEQEELLPGEKGVLPFPYPPHVAVVYAPLSLLPFRAAYTAHVLLMTAALLLAVWVMVKNCEGARRFFPLLFALALTFYPMLKSLLGGQNSAASLLLLTLIWAYVLKRRDVPAGIFLGLLLFKPQFGLPLIGLFGVAGRWKTAATALGCGLAFFGVSYLTMEPALTKWFEFTPWFSAIDAGVNKANAVSYLGFFEALLGTSNPVAQLVGWTLTGASIILITALWYRESKTADFNPLMGMTAPLLVLMPPHVMYYDLSLAMVGLPAAGGYLRRPAELIGVLWLLGWTQPLAAWLGVSPLFPVGVGLWIFLCRILLPEVGCGHGKPSRE